MNTKNLDKNATNVALGNNRTVCVSDKTHSLICRHDLTKAVGNTPVDNITFLCNPCDSGLRIDYNAVIENPESFLTYEH